MTFGDPRLLWLGLLAPLAGLAVALLWRRRLAAAAAWASRALWGRLRFDPRPRLLAASALLLGLAVLGTGLALARPRWGMAEEKVERKGVDIVFVLDSSLSMAAADARPSRFAVAQGIIRRMVSSLPGHRVALVQAEGEGMVSTPLTTDGAVIDLLLDSIEPASLPTPGTRLAAAVKLGLGLFPQGGEKHRVMVVVSDGEDHGGGIDTLLSELEEGHVVLHAVGVGTPAGAPIPLPDEQGGYKRDEDGQVVVSRLGEELLERLAESRDGVYLRAASAAADPAPILERIDDMETRRLETEVLSLLEERFQWPLGAALLALLGTLAMGLVPFRQPRETS